MCEDDKAQHLYSVLSIKEVQLWNVKVHLWINIGIGESQSSDSYSFCESSWHPFPKVRDLKEAIGKSRLSSQLLPRFSAQARPKSSLWFQLTIASHVIPGIIPFLRSTESRKGATELSVLGIGTSYLLWDGDTEIVSCVLFLKYRFDPHLEQPSPIFSIGGQNRPAWKTKHKMSGTVSIDFLGSCF